MLLRQIGTPAGEVTICFTGADQDLTADSFAQTYHNLREKLGNRLSIVWAEQVHGNSVVVYESVHQPIVSAGVGDAIVVKQYGIAPLVRTADCIPILLYAENLPLVAAVHAGWRGLQKKVFSAALAVIAGLGVSLADLRFIVGPFIRENSYEVNNDVAEKFPVRCSEPKSDGKFLLNLKSILCDEMQSLGILPQQVTWYDADTFSSREWFSARRGDTGRNLALIFYTEIR
jgi:hypothetical protein